MYNIFTHSILYAHIKVKLRIDRMERIMAKRSFPGNTALSPLPAVMVSCGRTGEKPNIITVAWTGIINSHPAKTYVSIRPERYSHDIIKETGEFVINLTSSELTRKCDSCGVYTGKKVDKFKKYNLTPEYPENNEVSCPMIGESPISLCCKVDRIIPLGSHDMFIADIVGVYVDEKLIDENNRISYEKASLVSYVHGGYFAKGKKLGTFGYSVAKKKKK